MSKITPQQAFEAAKVLWPNATHIEADPTGWLICGAERADIDWPSGVMQWPQPEPKWRDATIDDFIAERAARFRDDDDEEWHESTIAGFSRTSEYCWESGDDLWWLYCQVQETEPAPTFGGKAIDIKADPTLKPGEMAIKPARTKPTITIGGETIEVDGIEIDTWSTMMQEALGKGSPVQCGIDWAKPGNDKTATEPKTVPFIGGPSDGRFAFCDRKRRCVSVPVANNQEGYYADEDSPRPRLKQFVYDLRTIADVSMYAPSGMTDQDILIRLFENYHPPKAAT